MLLHFENALYSFLFISSRFCSPSLPHSLFMSRFFSHSPFCNCSPLTYLSLSLTLFLSAYYKNRTKLAIVPIIVRLVHTKYSHNWLGKCVYRLYVIYVTAISFVWISIFHLRRVFVHVYVIWVSFAGSFSLFSFFSLLYFLLFARIKIERCRGEEEFSLRSEISCHLPLSLCLSDYYCLYIFSLNLYHLLCLSFR